MSARSFLSLKNEMTVEERKGCVHQLSITLLEKIVGSSAMTEDGKCMSRFPSSAAALPHLICFSARCSSAVIKGISIACTEELKMQQSVCIPQFEEHPATDRGILLGKSRSFCS